MVSALQKEIPRELIKGTIGGLIAGMVVGLPLLLLAYYLRRRAAGSDKVHPSPPPGKSDQFVVQPPAAWNKVRTTLPRVCVCGFSLVPGAL